MDLRIGHLDLKGNVLPVLVVAILCLSLVPAMAVRPAQAASPVLYSENFNSYSNGATPTAWTNEVVSGSNVWAVENGTYQALHASNGWAASLYEGQTFTNFRMTVLASGSKTCYNSQQPPVLAVVFRATDPDNNYYFWADIDKIQIQKNVNGNWQWPSSGSSTAWKNIGQVAPSGTWYNMTVIVNGTSITAIWNNQYTLTATDSEFSSGYIGVATYNCNAEFDNVIVTGLTSTTDPPPTLTLNNIANNTKMVPYFQFSFTAKDAVAVSKVWYTVNGGARTCPAGGCTANSASYTFIVALGSPTPNPGTLVLVVSTNNTSGNLVSHKYVYSYGSPNNRVILSSWNFQHGTFWIFTSDYDIRINGTRWIASEVQIPRTATHWVRYTSVANTFATQFAKATNDDRHIGFYGYSSYNSFNESWPIRVRIIENDSARVIIQTQVGLTNSYNKEAIRVFLDDDTSSQYISVFNFTSTWTFYSPYYQLERKFYLYDNATSPLGHTNVGAMIEGSDQNPLLGTNDLGGDLIRDWAIGRFPNGTIVPSSSISENWVKQYTDSESYIPGNASPCVNSHLTCHLPHTISATPFALTAQDNQTGITETWAEMLLNYWINPNPVNDYVGFETTDNHINRGALSLAWIPWANGSLVGDLPCWVGETYAVIFGTHGTTGNGLTAEQAATTDSWNVQSQYATPATTTCSVGACGGFVYAQTIGEYNSAVSTEGYYTFTPSASAVTFTYSKAGPKTLNYFLIQGVTSATGWTMSVNGSLVSNAIISVTASGNGLLVYDPAALTGTTQTITISSNAAPPVQQPIKLTLNEGGAPTQTFTISGCSPSPSTIAGDGNVHLITMNANCAFSVVGSASSGARWGFVSGSTFSSSSTSQTSCSSGTCAEIDLNYDYQLRLTVNGGNGVAYSVSSETNDGWYKYGDSLTVSTNSIWNRASGTGTRLASWNLDGGTNTVVAQTTTFTTPTVTMTAPHTVNFNSVTQYQITVTTGTGGSASATTAPTLSGDTGWYDSGTSVQVSATPNSGYTFSGWSGSGTGSYTGANNPASVTMSSAITEAALFSVTGAGGGPLALDGSVSVSANGATSVTASLTTAKGPDVIVAFVTIYTGSSAITVSSVTSAHLTFVKRGAVNNVGYESIEEWYALSASALSGETVTVKFSAGAYATGTIFGISGANTATVFDPSSTLPKTATGESGTAPTIAGASTTNPNDMIISAYGTPGSADSVTAGSGFTMIYHGHSPQNFGSEYEVVSSTQSGLTVRFTGGTNFWAGIADAIVQSSGSPTIVTQPIKVTLQNTYGGSAQTVTIGGSCSSSPSTFAGDGSVHSITMNPGCTFTLSIPGGYQITGGTGTTTCASGTCAEYDTTYEVAPVTQPIGATFVTTYGGTIQTLTIGGSCSPSPSTVAGDGSSYAVTMAPNCPFTLSVPSGYQIVAGGSSTSCASGTCAAYTATTYELSPPPITQPISVGLLESGAPTGTYTVNGCSASPTTGVTGATTSFTMAPSCSFTISFTNSGGIRWGFITGSTFSATSTLQSTCASGSCSTVTLNADYQTQLVVTGGNGVAYSLPSETSDLWYKYGDSLTVSSNGIWSRSSGTGLRVSSWNVDGGSSTVVATTGTVTTSSITMTATHTANFVSVTQYQLTLASSPSAGGSATTSTATSIPGDTGWYDSGTGVSVSATPNSGYTFGSWSGSGTGSYSGSNNPASATMSGAITETALFSSPSTSPALDGSSSAYCSSGSLASCTVKLTTSGTNDVIVLYVYRATGSASYTISDTAGLTWHTRSVAGSPPSALVVYYAIAPSALSSDSIKAQLSATASETLNMMAFGVSGASTSSPFDPGVSSECYAKVNVAAGGSGSCSITNSNANDLVFGLVFDAQGGGVTTGSGYTSMSGTFISKQSGDSLAEYRLVSSTGSQAISFTNSATSTQTFYIVGDAIQ